MTIPAACHLEQLEGTHAAIEEDGEREVSTRHRHGEVEASREHHLVDEHLWPRASAERVQEAFGGTGGMRTRATEEEMLPTAYATAVQSSADGGGSREGQPPAAMGGDKAAKRKETV